MKKILVTFLLLGLNLFCISHAEQKVDAFTVKFLDKRISVSSPEKGKGPFGLIIKNKTLVKMVGKIETPDQRVLEYVVIAPKGDKVMELTHLSATNRLFFVPMSPPLQKIELRPGNKFNEIPPRTTEKN